MNLFSFVLNNGYIIAVQLGLIFGLVHFAWSLTVLRTDIPLYTPQEYYQDRLKSYRTGPDNIGPDMAWPVYTTKQAAMDRAVVKRNLKRLVAKLWKWPADTFFKGRHGPRWAWWILLFPVPASVLLFNGAAFLTSWFSYWVYWAVIFAFQFTDKTVIASLRLHLRGREDKRRVTMYTDAACMNCLHVTPWPAYHCLNPHCDLPHHHLQPGNLGTFTRRCRCGAAFPAVPSRAAFQLKATCRRCKQALPRGAGAVRDIRVPIFGDTSAGKTRFLFAALNSLTVEAERAHIPVAFLDDSSRNSAELGLKVIRAGQDIAKTPESGPFPISLQLRKGRDGDFVHLFDAAGEQYSNARYFDDLRFLEDGQALAYVLDPFSIDALRDQVSGDSPAVLAAAHVAEHNTEIAYGEVVNRLRGAGISLRSQRLAIVVSKADLLHAAGISVPTRSAAIAKWLTDMGLYNLVTAAGREFRDVTFFTVASQDVAASQGHDPGLPLRWLLAVHDVKIPGGAAALAAASSQ
jgi:hypothetical protein